MLLGAAARWPPNSPLVLCLVNTTLSPTADVGYHAQHQRAFEGWH